MSRRMRRRRATNPRNTIGCNRLVREIGGIRVWLANRTTRDQATLPSGERRRLPDPGRSRYGALISGSGAPGRPAAERRRDPSGGTMMLKEKAEIVDADGLRRIITRIAHEVVERNKGVDDLVLVGIRRRGVPLAHRIADKIGEFERARPALGSLDITLYRDDLSTVAHQPVV